MNKPIACVLLALLAIAGVSCDSKEPATSQAMTKSQVATPTKVSATAKPLYSFALNDIEGNPVTLGQYQGKVLLLVNVASKCGYTKQYAGLEALYEKYKDEGLVVLGFPANNFGGQEPGTNEEILAFCTSTFNVAFPMFAKISVKGDDIDPLYAYLTSAETDPDFAGDITWNFNRFLVSRTGEIIGRYDSNVEPMSPTLVGDIEKALQSG
jgi:glutathione peroxidase-family protein